MSGTPLPSIRIVRREADGAGPVDDRVGTVLMLPGRAYPCSMSLLAWTTRALQGTGWTVFQAEWDLPDLPTDPRAFIQGVAQQLDELERRPGPVLVVAKSLGTLAAHWGAERGYPAVWLTPVLKPAGWHPLPGESDALAERIRTYPVDNLVVGGTADPLWQPGFRGTGAILELEGADHSLEVADWRTSVRHHERVAVAVADFAAGLGPAVGAPDIRTERLRLARPMTTDSADVFAILGDPRTVEHNPSDRLEDLGEAAELVARWIRHWEEHGFGYWCVRESGSDRIIGYAGVKRMLMHERPVLNLVYRFIPEVWGRGLATEAAAAVVSQALDDMPAETIVARVRPDNGPSRNVALKAGLRRDPAMDCQGEDGLDWAFTSPDVR